MYNTVKVGIEAEGYEFVDTELSMIPDNYMAVSDKQRTQFEKMLDVLEQDDDVQDVYPNMEG